MATQTHTLRKAAAQPARVHDYLYDPIHKLSSERDHARATFKAHTSTNRVKRVPIFKSMFSEVRHHPRFQMRLDVTDPVPKFIHRQWRGYADQSRDAMIRYTTFNYDPSVSVPARSYENAGVAGTNRYKYFRRPIIPFLQQVPPDVLLATTRQDPLAAPDQAQLERARTPLTKTIETQTDYRDSETQTDPYTPEYVVRPGSQPELLTLATLSYSRGLPAGLAEVEMIERARAKRAWEVTLPPLSDTDQLEKRRKMMDEMERKEWALREQEIEKLQEARLEVLKKLLGQREEHHQELNTKRLDRLWAKKQEEKEERVKKIRSEHIKTIRKLTKKRSEVEGKLERRDIVHDYSDLGSQAYAPMTRIGVFLDRGSEQYVVKSHYLSTYQGLLELENSLPDFVTAPRVKAPKPKTVTKAGFTKRRYRQERELAEIHEVIKHNKNREEEPPKPLRFLQKIEKPIPRPPTPAVQVPSEEEEQRDLSIIFLQQVIRGRAIQNMMFEGKEKRIELIRELRSTHALQEAEQSMKKQEKQATLALQRQRRLHDHKESYIDEALGQMEGECLGDMLDFLGKELIRLQEERRIHAFSMLAERQRRIREAEESGRRQVEQRRRREEDEIFKQTIKVHQDSVDTYLQDIILGSVDKTADEQARKEVDEQAEIINDIAYGIEDTRTELQSEEIVSELVHGFLLPEVQKIDMREKVHRHQRKYLAAAHREIHSVSEEILPMFPRKATAPAVEPTPVTTAQTEATPATTAQTETEPATPAQVETEPATPTQTDAPTDPAPQQLEANTLTEPEILTLDEKTAVPDAVQTEGTADPTDSSGDKPASRPPSKAGSRPTSAQKTSRPSSAQKTSRPTSAQKPSSRPSSAQKPGSRRGSSSSQKSQKSRTATPEAPSGGPDMSIQGVELTLSGSPTPKAESPKPAGTPTGSKPSSRQGSQAGSRPSSRPSSAAKQ